MKNWNRNGRVEENWLRLLMVPVTRGPGPQSKLCNLLTKRAKIHSTNHAIIDTPYLDH